MDQKEISSIFKAWQEVVEKKKLDPVDDKANDKMFKDRKDKDIDNDGDVDSSDEYLHKRRKATDDAIDGGKKPAKEAIEVDNDDKDGMTKCAECGGSSENHDADCSKAASSEKKKAMKEKDMDTSSARGAMKHDCATHVASEAWGYGECIPGEHTLVEQEDGSAIVTHYDVMFEHGIEKDVPVEELKIMAESSHMHASKKKDKTKTLKAQKACESVELDEVKLSDMEIHNKLANRNLLIKAINTAEKMAGNMTGAVREIEKMKKGLSKHKAVRAALQQANESVEVAESTVAEFSNEVENAYMQSAVDAMRKMGSLWERAAGTAKDNKEKQPMFDKDQQNSYDAIKKDHNLENPEVVKDGEKIEKEQSAGVTKQAPARGSADSLGNGDKKPVKQGA